ncbi:DUF7668 domain-containing protein [Solimonas sp. K1W22B-7]|uniref:DUF7668 domain-containing protein n=1 Tax=Solimonas sp. K1W22B-7 TaxID=2303331 RepID=UPI0013C493A7|nr:hypothetical protein [Solimonas sp. K1W22B-7]
MKNQGRQARDRVISELLALLAAGQYVRLQELSAGIRISAAQIEQAVVQYGRTIVPLPENAVELIDYIEINGSRPKAWSVCSPVFTREEGQSDLFLELTLIESALDSYRIELDGLHVL